MVILFRKKFLKTVHGEEMYKYFLERGYIHELRQSPEGHLSPRWELTRLGEDFYKRFYQA